MINILLKWINQQEDFDISLRSPIIVESTCPERKVEEFYYKRNEINIDLSKGQKHVVKLFSRKLNSKELLKRDLLILNEKANKSKEEFFGYVEKERENMLIAREKMSILGTNDSMVLKYFYLYNQLLQKSVEQVLINFDSTDKTSLQTEPHLASIFNENNNAFEVCLGMLDDMGLTIKGIPNTNKWAGKIIGAITAIKNKPGMLKADYSNPKLLKYFNNHLNTDFTTFDKRSKGFEEGFDDAKRYIENNFKK